MRWDELFGQSFIRDRRLRWTVKGKVIRRCCFQTLFSILFTLFLFFMCFVFFIGIWAWKRLFSFFFHILLGHLHDDTMKYKETGVYIYIYVYNMHPKNLKEHTTALRITLNNEAPHFRYSLSKSDKSGKPHIRNRIVLPKPRDPE